MKERFLTVAEAAVAIGRSSQTVVRLIRAGRLQAVRVGLGTRAPLFVSENAVRALVRSMRQPAGRRP